VQHDKNHVGKELTVRASVSCLSIVLSFYMWPVA